MSNDHEESVIVITLEGEDFLVKTGEDQIKLLVIPLGINSDDAVSVVEGRDSVTGDISYSAIVPEHDSECSGTWDKAVQVAGLVMAQAAALKEHGVLM